MSLTAQKEIEIALTLSYFGPNEGEATGFSLSSLYYDREITQTMALDSEYFTIDKPTTARLTVKGSRFVARALPSDSRNSAEDHVERVSKKHRDATHNCFGYRVGVGDEVDFRFSDAGEPSGTAGRPILQAIESKRLTNVVVVVTRYFGGTKLGTGGLIRAYNSAALAALDRATLVRHFPKISLRLKFTYELANAVHQVVEKFGGRIAESRFQEGSVYCVELKASEEADFRAKLRDVSRGQVVVEEF